MPLLFATNHYPFVDGVDDPLSSIMVPFSHTVAKAAGVEAAILFSLHYGGLKVYIPGTLPADPDHWMIRLVGHSAAAKICDAFSAYTPMGAGNAGSENVHRGGGLDQMVPKFALCLTEQQVVRVLERTSLNQAAAELGFTVRTVSRWRRILRERGLLPPSRHPQASNSPALAD